MITVTEALAHLFDLASPLPSETVSLAQANGRVLVHPVAARRDQPPFSSSAMDGYAVKASEVSAGAQFTVIGEAAAGHGFDGKVSAGQAVRIFTGAPVPEGADRIIIQEDVERTADVITLKDTLDQAPYVRAKGSDFKDGQTIDAPRVLRPNDIALLASMNIAQVPVTRRPRVAIMSTGDELVMPGDTPGPDQIITSNSFGLQAMLQDMGCDTRLLPIARDTEASLRAAFSHCDDVDLVITIGGASVGDHDLVGQVAADLGMQRSFYKIAMRPGKPLMAGRLATGAMMIGLPGNPVSAMVCGTVFVAPVIRAMLGLGAAPAAASEAPLAHDISANGKREHYMRARLQDGKLTVFERQDSALLTVLSDANALAIRPVNDPAKPAGSVLKYIPI
ncbi:gephyrin-like molybdotransferase Glp [Cognatishimia sp.]|uniref:molybdopterin molybdotransferase MoeA n=1 Tax=Cognatishimia sp. TaxID=2211648 RepID=UPI0035140D9C